MKEEKNINKGKGKDKEQDAGKNFKGGRRFDKSGGSKKTTEKTVNTKNDPAWYNHSPELVKSAGSIPFVNFTGIPYAISGDMPYNISGGYVVPGICKLTFAPSIGVSGSKEDTANVVASKIYAEMRRWNSGSRNYEAPDYLMHLLAIDSAFMLWATAVRAYGLVNAYSLNNRYTPKRLFEALGINYDDLSQNMANFRTLINSFGAKLNTCPLPKVWDIVKRHMFMCSNVYMDHNNSKSQLYVFNPHHVWKFSGTTYETGTALTPVTFAPANDGGLTVREFGQMFETVIDSLLNNEDVSIMAGDTLKAFPDCWTVGAIDETYTTEFIYDEAILSQIHNATLVGMPVINKDAMPIYGYNYVGSPFDVWQENGIIMHKPYVYASGSNNSDASSYVDYGHIIDWYGKDEPTPLEIMYISRFQSQIGKTVKANHAGTDAYRVAPIESCGSELILYADIYQITADTGMLDRYRIYGTMNYTVQDMSHLIKLTQFDWHPRVVIVLKGANMSSQFIAFDQCWESKNIAVLSNDNVRNLNNVALLSLLDIPIRESKM